MIKHIFAVILKEFDVRLRLEVRIIGEEKIKNSGWGRCLINRDFASHGPFAISALLITLVRILYAREAYLTVILKLINGYNSDRSPTMS